MQIIRCDAAVCIGFIATKLAEAISTNKIGCNCAWWVRQQQQMPLRYALTLEKDYDCRERGVLLLSAVKRYHRSSREPAGCSLPYTL
jgi:hypothetical protein